jgi:hypothetical protein
VIGSGPVIRHPAYALEISGPQMSSLFHIFACARASDADTLSRDLLRSPAIAKNEVPLSVLWNQESASSAFRDAVQNAEAEFLIFTHCDVYFPKLWFERLEWEVNRLALIDADWAVAGISAITPSGELVGRIWDTSLEPITHGIFGKALTVPVPIVSTDELAFVVRRGAGINFDPLLPNFHLYGTDIILTAERNGKRSYGLDMPLIHNAKAQLVVGSDYVKSYKYMVRKWRNRLPVPTTCGTITSNPIRPLIRRLRVRYKALIRPSTYSTRRVLDPSAKAIELGLDQLLEVPRHHSCSL